MMADSVKLKRLLKTARGQVDGLLQMVEDDRYCIDISNQLLATIAILKKVNIDILDAHLEHCVTQALTDKEAEKKVEEVMLVIRKLAK